MISSDRSTGILCAIMVVILFSSFTLVSRLGFSSSLTVLDLAALRFGIGGTLLIPVLLRYGLSGLRWRDAAAIAFLGGLGFALFAYAGFLLAPAAHGAVLLHGTLPLFTFAILRATGQQPPSRYRSTGVALIGTGILFMTWDSLSGASLRQLIGDGCLLLASLCWSTYGVLARRLGLASAQAAAIVAVLSMSCFLPIYILLPNKALLLASPTELLLQGVFQGVLIGVASIFVYTRAVAALGAAQTSLFTAAVPLATTLVAVPLLAEFPSNIVVVGVGIVTIGMFVAMRQASDRDVM